MPENPMLKFVSRHREMPVRRAPELRKEDYDEIYKEFAKVKAAEQAARCSQCGVPYCQSHCPLHNNIPDWLLLTAEGRLEEAYELSQATNNFPEICGRICPQDRLCEGGCVIEQAGHETVTIGAIEKYLTETAWKNGWVKPLQPAQEKTQSIGVIGAGPAGMAAAEMLRIKGYQVTIYDRHDRAGGLMTYGIPSFKLEKDIILRRVALLEDAGVTIKCNADIVTSAQFDKIHNAHDAILIATGVYKSRDLTIPQATLKGVVKAIDYLTVSNRLNFGDTVEEFESGELSAKDKSVIVIGGGDTAMDCVRTAIRQGAKSVKCLYRRDRKNMPGSVRETKNAEDEGVEFIWLAAPKAFLGSANIEYVLINKMKLGAPDQTGRQAPEIIPDGDYKEPVDLVIKALGFEPEDIPGLWGQPELAVTRWGTITTNDKHETSMTGIYAAGDIVRGASLVVWGIKDGREAAESIHQYLDAKAVK